MKAWIIMVAACVVAVVSGCAMDPTPFATGDAVSPPLGCIEMRERGGEC
jgi:hypothetical protein